MLMAPDLDKHDGANCKETSSDEESENFLPQFFFPLNPAIMVSHLAFHIREVPGWVYRKDPVFDQQEACHVATHNCWIAPDFLDGICFLNSLFM